MLLKYLALDGCQRPHEAHILSEHSIEYFIVAMKPSGLVLTNLVHIFRFNSKELESACKSEPEAKASVQQIPWYGNRHTPVNYVDVNLALCWQA